MTDQRSNDVEFTFALLAPRYWLLWVWFGILWAVSRLPYPAMCSVGSALGRVLYHLLSSRRKIALKTLAVCLPELDETAREKLARDSFAAMGITLFESGIVWWTRPERAAHIFRVSGVEKLDAALAADQRVLLIGTHMTCIEFALSHLTTRVPFSVLYRVHDNPVFEYVSGRGRAQFEIELLPRKRVADFLDRIRKGKVGTIVPDQDMGANRSVYVPFFNETAATITAVSDYARDTGARVALVKSYRTSDGHVAVEVGEFLDDFPGDDLVADTTRVNQIIESAIREHPGQYLWAHRRFKTRPEGAPSIY